MVTRRVSSWGKLSDAEHTWVPVGGSGDVAAAITRRATPGLAFGNGRSYGDVCLNAGGTLWATRGLDRFIAFDRDRGEIECEAGVLLSEVIEVALPHGWFVPVTPGTRFVTVGGAVANDVHGKNHHRAGTFGEHVRSLQLVRSDGRAHCSPQAHGDRFAATVGGLGLTGVIESVRLGLRRVPGDWIDVESESFETLAHFHALSAEAGAGWEYVVAWIDASTAAAADVRGVLFRGNHAPHDAKPPRTSIRRMPVELSGSLVGATSVRLFNAAYRRRHEGRARYRQHQQAFFYPLDGLLEWNRIYGRRGFYQYQCVLPAAGQVESTRELLRSVAMSGAASFLAVLKTFEARPPLGMLSFPLAGTTVALDFPNRGDETLRLFERLDAIVAAAGGRLYPAKDARMSMATFKASYPRWAEFEQHRDPGISSEMSRRLFGS